MQTLTTTIIPHNWYNLLKVDMQSNIKYVIIKISININSKYVIKH